MFSRSFPGLIQRGKRSVKRRWILRNRLLELGMMRMLIMPLLIVMMVIDGDGDKGDATIV